MAPVVFVLVLAVVLSSCSALTQESDPERSYEEAFIESYFRVGYDTLGELLDIVYGENDCSQFSSPPFADLEALSREDRHRITEELADERHLCSRGTESHALYVGRFFDSGPHLAHESWRIDSHPGPTTYSDVLGSVLWLQPMSGFGESAYEIHADALARVAETLIAEDRLLGTDPGLIVFSYHPNLTWGVGYVGEQVLIDGVAYPLDLDGPLFRIHGVELDQGPFVLEADGVSYELVVARRLGDHDYVFDQDHQTVVAYEPFDRENRLVDVVVDGCDVTGESERNGFYELLFGGGCVPSQVSFVTEQGSDTFWTFVPHEKPKLEFRGSEGEWHTWP